MKYVILLDGKNNVKNQRNELISRFIFGGILGYMIIAVVLTVLNAGTIIPQISDGRSLIEIFNSKFVIRAIVSYVIFQIILILGIYFIGIAKLIKRNAEYSSNHFSRISLICCLIMCIIFCIIAISAVNSAFNTSNVHRAINDYSNNFLENVISNDDYTLKSGEKMMSIADNTVNEVTQMYQNSQIESSQLLQNIILQFIIGELIVLFFAGCFNYIFFKNYIKKEEE